MIRVPLLNPKFATALAAQRVRISGSRHWSHGKFTTVLSPAASPGMARKTALNEGPEGRTHRRLEAQFCAIARWEVKMWKKTAIAVLALGLTTLGSGTGARAEDANQAALIKALGGAKHSLLQGIAQVAKGTEVPIEAKYEMEDGKLMLSIYTSAKGFDTAAEDNSFNEYIGEATTATWSPKKEVFADLKHIARSAQYHALLSMTKTDVPMIIRKASAQGTVLSVKEKVRGGKPVFEVMVVEGGTIKPTFYDLVTGAPTGG
jgi:hypothetical protein